MLEFVIEASETYDEKTNTFGKLDRAVIRMEHSLLSVSRWEERYEKPFLSEAPKTAEENRYYFECMLLDRSQAKYIKYFTSDEYRIIEQYLSKKSTATTIKKDGQHYGKHGNTTGQYITSELIYSWMVILRISKECEKWNLNRLFTLIDLVNEEQKPKKKMGKAATAQRNAALNKARRAKTGSSG